MESSPANPDTAPHTEAANGTIAKAPFTGQQRWAFERFPLVRDVRITVVDKHGNAAGSWVARTFDISRNGVGIHSSLPLVTSDPVVFDIFNSRHSKRYYGIVRRVDRHRAHGYTIGISFEVMPREVAEWARQEAGSSGAACTPGAPGTMRTESKPRTTVFRSENDRPGFADRRTSHGGPGDNPGHDGDRRG